MICAMVKGRKQFRMVYLFSIISAIRILAFHRVNLLWFMDKIFLIQIATMASRIGLILAAAKSSSYRFVTLLAGFAERKTFLPYQF